MLGQLFHSWASTRRQLPLGRQANTVPEEVNLESATEDAHTSALLFPTPETLSHASDHVSPLKDATSASLGTFDQSYHDQTALGPLDVRILLAQDDVGTFTKTVLFDSLPPRTPSAPSSPSSDSFGSRVLISGPEDFPLAEAGSLRSPISSRPTRVSTVHFPPSANSPRDPRRHARGNSVASAYTRPPDEFHGAVFRRAHSRGSSISSNLSTAQSERRAAKDADDEIQTCLECMFGNAKPKDLANSTKIHVIPKENLWDPRPLSPTAPRLPLSPLSSSGRSFPARPSFERTPSRHSNSSQLGTKVDKSLLITRTFHIDVNNTLFDDAAPESVDALSRTKSNDLAAAAADDGKSGIASARTPRQRRSPTFAVSLIIDVPKASPRRHRGDISPTPEAMNSWSSSIFPDSHSSRDSSYMTRATILGAARSMFESDNIDDGTDAILQHWDVIARILDQLQKIAEQRLVAARAPNGSELRRSGSLPLSFDSTERRGPYDESLARLNRTFRMLPSEFQSDQDLRDAADHAARRLLQVYTARLVIHGQERWGVWREEARWVDRWAQEHDKNSILSLLLTASLSLNLEWLGLVAPQLGRKIRQARLNQESGRALQTRTIVISKDKMEARRLVFLLSAFFPRSRDPLSPGNEGSNTNLKGDSYGSPLRSTTSSSLAGERQADTGAAEVQNGRATLQQPPSDSHISDRNFSNLSAAIKAQASFMQGSSNTAISQSTSSTVDISSTTPVAHFASPGSASAASSRGFDTAARLRRSSTASNRLLDRLQNSPAATRNTTPRQSSEGVRSRKASIDVDQERPRKPDVSESNARAADIGKQLSDEDAVQDKTGNKLEQMVDDLNALGITQGPKNDNHASVPMPIKKASAQRTLDVQSGLQMASPTFSLSVNEKDGFIDVQFPLASLDSSMQTQSWMDRPPRMTASVSSSSLTASTWDPQEVAIGGYLPLFHEDLRLQAVRPYDELETEVRKAMQAEPAPDLPFYDRPDRDDDDDDENHRNERWITICSTILADSDAGTVKRLSLSRLVRERPAVRSCEVIDEEFTVDHVTEADEHMISAVDRLLTQSGPPSRSPSLISVQSASMRRGHADGQSSLHEGTSFGGRGVEVHRDACRRTMMGALELVLRSAKRDLEGNEGTGRERPSMLHRALKKRLREMGYVSKSKA